MVHVSKPIDEHLAPKQYSIEAIRVALEEAGADDTDKKLLALSGAIWHIWPAHQSDKIREVLHDVARERGKPLGDNDDPIHDQVREISGGKSSWELPSNLTFIRVLCLTKPFSFLRIATSTPKFASV